MTNAVPSPPPTAGQRALGVVLLLPAVVLTLAQFTVPAIMTFVGSLQSITIRPGSDFVGLTNYRMVAGLLPAAIGIAVLLSLGAALIAVLGGVIGAVAARGGALPRRITAAIAGTLLALYAPVGMTLTLGDNGDPMARSVAGLFLISVAVWLPPVLAGGVVAGLLSGRPGRTRVRSLVAAGLFGIVAAGAVGLQAFAVPLVVGMGSSGAGPFQTSAFELGFIRADFGAALALETLVLIGLAVLGVVATVILTSSRLRLELTAPTSARGNAGGWIGRGLAGLALRVVLVIHRGWLADLVAPAEAPPAATTRWMINTWGPSLVLAVIQVVVSGVAGFGLGWLRPAGRGSAWLLLLFAPWLLLGASPLVVQHYLTAMQLGVVGTWVTALPPIWLSLPAMVAFSWLFGALGDAHRAARQGTSTSTTGDGVLTGAAGTVLIGALLWLTGAQSLIWSYVTDTGQDRLTGPVALIFAAGRRHYTGPGEIAGTPQWISTPIPVLMLLAVLISVSAILVTDRLALVTGKDPATAVPDLAHGPATEQAHPSAPTAVPGRGDHGPVEDRR